MVSNINMLDSISIRQPTESKHVQLPNGDKALVTHIGSSSTSEKDTFNNVFVLPQFKYNLISVS